MLVCSGSSWSTFLHPAPLLYRRLAALARRPGTLAAAAAAPAARGSRCCCSSCRNNHSRRQQPAGGSRPGAGHCVPAICTCCRQQRGHRLRGSPAAAAACAAGCSRGGSCHCVPAGGQRPQGALCKRTCTYVHMRLACKRRARDALAFFPSLAFFAPLHSLPITASMAASCSCTGGKKSGRRAGIPLLGPLWAAGPCCRWCCCRCWAGRSSGACR